MIILTYKTLNDEGFNKALATIAAQTGYADFQASYNVAKIARKFGTELKTARETYAKWVDAYIVKDEKGVPKMAAEPNQHVPWEIKEGMQEEFEKGMENFMKTEITIEAAPLKLTDLGQVKLSPLQILTLEPVFDPAAFSQQEPSPH